MKITLELWDDQSDASEADVNSTNWVLKLNDEEFPMNTSLMDLTSAHRIVCRLMDIECIAEGVNIPIPQTPDK